MKTQSIRSAIGRVCGTMGRAFRRAERMLRGHLLPSQLRDVSFIADAREADKDGKRAVWQRLRGAIGFPAPYGHKSVEGTDLGFNLDIVGGSVAFLCEAYRQVVVQNESGHAVSLVFDHETPAIKVESPYPHGILSVTVKEIAPLAIWMPAWIDRTKSGLTVRRRIERGRRISCGSSFPSSAKKSRRPGNCLSKILPCATARARSGLACAGMR